jgi:hypothetical protein
MGQQDRSGSDTERPQEVVAELTANTDPGRRRRTLLARGVPPSPSHAFRARPTPVHVVGGPPVSRRARRRPYILSAWYVRWLVGTIYVEASSAVTRPTLVGRWIVLLFQPAAHNEPHSREADSKIRLPRPDGTTRHVEQYGPLTITHSLVALRPLLT